MDKPARYCEYCGKPLNERARFCGRCGKPVDLGGGQQAGPPSQPLSQAPPLPRPAQPAPPRPSQPLPQAPHAPATSPPRHTQPPAAPAPRQPPPPRPSQPLPPPPAPYPVAPAAPELQPAAAPPETVCGVIPGAYQRKGALGLGQQSFSLVLTNYRVIFAMQTSQMMQEQVKMARDNAKQQGKGFFGQWGAQFSASITYYMQQPPQAVLAEQPGNFFIPYDQLRSVKFHVIHGGEDSQDDYRLDFETVTGKVSVKFNMIDQKKAKQALTQVLGEKVHWSSGFLSF
jgi:hypothetical protein